jgi:serine protease SohB
MLSDWLSFLLNGVTAGVLITLFAGVILAMAAAARKSLRSGGDDGGSVEFKPLREDADDLRSSVEKALHDNSDELRGAGKKGGRAEGKAAGKDGGAPSKKELKAAAKPLKDKALDAERDGEAEKRREAIAKMRGEGKFCPRNLYVIDYDGDVKGSGNKAFAREVSAVLEYGTSEDELVVNLRSPGGMVSAYGYASSQLSRVRARGIRLVVCVDEVAASGGYLMAAVADRIVAAPFSYIGSIGVVAEFPNFNRLLEKQGVQYEQVTAGRYKRTLTMLGRNTYEGREKMKGELEAVHRRFKELVSKFRPQVDIDAIATGEFWLGRDALELGLVDEIGTSDDYIRSRMDATSGAALKIIWRKEEKKPIFKKVLGLLSARTWVRAACEEIEEKASRRDGSAIR